MTECDRSVHLKVRGITPRPWGTARQWEWRSAITAQAAQVGRAELSDADSPTFQVELIFYLMDGSFRVMDVDNLAKPVLDTLFRSTHSQAPDESLTGCITDFDDNSVTKLTLEKRIVVTREDEGVEIFIRW